MADEHKKGDHHEGDGHEHHGHHDEFTIIVNAREKKVHKDVLSFEEVVALAFESAPGSNVIYTVAYRNADQEPHHGTLVAGQTVKIKNGTIFNVSATNKS